MRLTTLATVATAMGLDSGLDTENAVLDAIESATDSLAGWSRNTFERTSRQDDFAVNLGELGAGCDIIGLALKQGFVAATPALTVKAARALAVFGTADEVNLTSQVDVDKEKGVVSFSRDADFGEIIFSSIRARQMVSEAWWFRVTYTAGLLPDANDPDLYAGVPPWLVRAANLQARISLNAHPAFVANQTTTDYKMIETQLVHIMASRLRYLPSAVTPKNSRTF